MSFLLSLLMGLALAAEPTIEELLLATDDANRGESSTAVMQMHVKTSNYDRTMKMQVWSKGTTKTLVKILEPQKDAGVTTLKVEDNLWNYLPKVDRTMKVPAGMMSGSWMGSHFTNDDLVRESRLSEDFGCAFEKKPADAGSEGNYVIACTPKPEAPVVWGKVVATVTPDKVPVKIEYWDEKGNLVRTMTYSDVRDIEGRKTPMTMRLVPHDKPGEFTEMAFQELDFGADIPDSTFSLQSLKQ
jgi:outer membrane lipoprotein-sorting protein